MWGRPPGGIAPGHWVPCARKRGLSLMECGDASAKAMIAVCSRRGGSMVGDEMVCLGLCATFMRGGKT